MALETRLYYIHCLHFYSLVWLRYEFVYVCHIWVDHVLRMKLESIDTILDFMLYIVEWKGKKTWNPWHNSKIVYFNLNEWMRACSILGSIDVQWILTQFDSLIILFLYLCLIRKEARQRERCLSMLMKKITYHSQLLSA